MAFHEGELAVQEKVGVVKQAGRVGASIRPEIPAPARYFLEQQPYIFAGSSDRKGRIWASILMGEVGFIKVLTDRIINIGLPVSDGILLENLQTNDQIGLLAIEFETRRRMRANGRARIDGDSLIIQTEEVFSNCPKYIQARFWERNENPIGESESSACLTDLTADQTGFIENSDTFIIASSHRTGGADVSHRGGNPGFIRVLDGKRLLFPDYSGNMMFQTLGNLHLNPNCGLLFYDFSNGRLLQLTGTAKIIWEGEQIKDFAGAERLIEFELIEVRESRLNTNLSWYFIDNSPFNPK